MRRILLKRKRESSTTARCADLPDFSFLRASRPALETAGMPCVRVKRASAADIAAYFMLAKETVATDGIRTKVT
jgi:hypothetical protein